MTRDDERIDREIGRAVRAGAPLPPPGFESRLLASLDRPAPSEPRARRLAVGIASATLAVLVVSAMLWTSPALRERLRAASARVPAPAGEPVPASAPDRGANATFLYQAVTTRQVTEPGRPDMTITQAVGPLLRADFTGAHRGSLALPPPAHADLPGGGVAVSPDGRYIEAARATDEFGGADPTAGVDILDEQGTRVAGDPALLGAWADDGHHLCLLDVGADDRLTLQVADLVAGQRVTHSSVGVAGLTGYQPVLACSATNDRALLMSYVNAPGQAVTVLPGMTKLVKVPSVNVVRLSTGRATHLDLPAGQLGVPVASLDGRYLAVTTSGDRPVTSIIDVDANRVVAHVDGTAVGLSGDDRLVALNTQAGAASVVDWRTGRAVWSDAKASIRLLQTRPMPGGRDIALGVERKGSVDVVVVRGDGHAVTVATGAELVVNRGVTAPVG